MIPASLLAFSQAMKDEGLRLRAVVSIDSLDMVIDVDERPYFGVVAIITNEYPMDESTLTPGNNPNGIELFRKRYDRLA